VATIERTVIDAIKRPDMCGGVSDIREILTRARSKTNIQKIMEYLPTYGSKSLIQKVGYLLDIFSFGLKAEDKAHLLSLCEGSKAYRFSPRQNGTSDVHHYSKEWHLVVNAPGFSPDQLKGIPK
jgi:predicted transcriptional regulator of viral defense system